MSVLNILIGNSVLNAKRRCSATSLLPRAFPGRSLTAYSQERKRPLLAGEGRGEGNQKGCAFKIPLILTPSTLLRAGFSLKGEGTKSLNCGQRS